MLDQILTPIVIALIFTYVYFWAVLLHAIRNKHIDTSVISDREIFHALQRARQKHHPELFIIQITTKGGSDEVVRRGISHVLDAIIQYPTLRRLVTVEVITEDPRDKYEIDQQFAASLLPVRVYLLPPDYQTPHKTELKARALHYMVEQHRQSPQDAYVVHYDEESVLTVPNVARLVRNLLRKPIGISEGSISYPLEWSDAHILCRTMESNRPFGCHECYLMMTNPAPLHLHGSNLVVQEKLENEIGWDIGRLGDKPLIAEDLVFGLMAYLKFGKKVFGWHHVEMLEQPPFTTRAAFKQRERWVMGALQGVAHVRKLANWKQLTLYERFRIQWVIRARVLTYAAGFPVSVIGLLVWTYYLGYYGTNLVIGSPLDMPNWWLGIPGLTLWLGSSQIGLWQNLRYTEMTKWQKVVEHLKVLLATPFSGLYDTAGPFVAVLKWMVGVRGIKWIPTPKSAGQQYGDNDAVQVKA